MAIGPRIDLRQSQTLVMTPQLQQAIKLLQLSNLDVAAFVEEELERNPLLERDDGDDDAGRAARARSASGARAGSLLAAGRCRVTGRLRSAAAGGTPRCRLVQHLRRRRPAARRRVQRRRRRGGAGARRRGHGGGPPHAARASGRAASPQLRRPARSADRHAPDRAARSGRPGCGRERERSRRHSAPMWRAWPRCGRGCSASTRAACSPATCASASPCSSPSGTGSIRRWPPCSTISTCWRGATCARWAASAASMPRIWPT